MRAKDPKVQRQQLLIVSWAMLAGAVITLVAGYFIADLAPEIRLLVYLMFAASAVVEVVIFFVLRHQARALEEKAPISWD